MKYRIRQKVIINCHVRPHCFSGAQGHVIKIDPDNPTPYLVQFDQKVDERLIDWEDAWFAEHELEEA